MKQGEKQRFENGACGVYLRYTKGGRSVSQEKK